MTKEELKQEARQKALQWDNEKINGKYNRPPIANWSCYEKGYLAGAEPREKRIEELEAQIEKMKCCGNCIHCKYDENEDSYEWCEVHEQIVNIAIVPCSEWKGR